MDSQGSMSQAALLPDKQAPPYTDVPVGIATGSGLPGQAYVNPSMPQGQIQPGAYPQPGTYPQPGVIYPVGQNPPVYTTVPQVQYVVRQPITNPPDDYLVQAILVTIFCFWPTGIIAIIKSMDSRRAAQLGDVQDAQLSSKAARKMSVISLVIGIAILMIIAIIIVIELFVVFTLY